ncbi:MAG: DMT family transporter [Novosphingobium sp.]
MDDRPQRPLFALALRIGSAFVFGTMFFIIKYAGEAGISVPEIMFWRQMACLPVVVAWMAATGQLRQIRTRRMASHAGRAMVGMTNMSMTFTATVILPLAVSTTLSFMSPVFAVLLAAFFFKDKVGPWRWSAVLLGFAGVVIVAQPGGEHVDPLGVGLMLTGAVLIAAINYQIRDLARTESSACIVFWFTVFGSLLMAPLMPFYMQAYTPFEWLLVISMGVTGALGQLLMTASLRHGAVASVIVMDYTQLIWATLFGWLVWDKLPGASLYFGAPLIIAAGAIIAFREQLLSRLRAREPSLQQVAD